MVLRARAGQICGEGAHDACVPCEHDMAYVPGTERMDVAKRAGPGRFIQCAEWV